MNVSFGSSPVVFDGCELNVDRQTGEIRQINGVNKYRVAVLVHEEGDFRSTPYTLNIASQKDPCLNILPFAPVVLKELELKTYLIKGETILSYWAKSIEKA